MKKSKTDFQLAKMFINFGGSKDAPSKMGVSLLPGVPTMGADYNSESSPEDDLLERKKKRAALNKYLMNQKSKGE